MWPGEQKKWQGAVYGAHGSTHHEMHKLYIVHDNSRSVSKMKIYVIQGADTIFGTLWKVCLKVFFAADSFCVDE